MRVLLVVLAVAVAGCGKKPSSPKPPPSEATPAAAWVELQYAAGSVVEDVELELTETRVGQYVEAKARVAAALELAPAGERLRTTWSLQAVEPLELVGTVAPDEHHKARGLLLARGKGLAVSDVHGLLDSDASDADPINAARLAAMDAKAPPAGVLMMSVLAELLPLPRLPPGRLRVGDQAEVEEESETVVVLEGAELVLPTTTVHRFTLRGVEAQGATRVAELQLEVASVAEPPADAADATAEPAAHIEIRTEGTLLFDLDAGIPVSLDLAKSETFTIGEATGERSVTLRSRFRAP